MKLDEELLGLYAERNALRDEVERVCAELAQLRAELERQREENKRIAASVLKGAREGNEIVVKMLKDDRAESLEVIQGYLKEHDEEAWYSRGNSVCPCSVCVRARALLAKHTGADAPER